ncbi:MAG: Hpt domain-containing protein [Desulfobulbaceae bacterium]|nr:Hpt domain-containing protein [Desulfobulbaceae bacterium]
MTDPTAGSNLDPDADNLSAPLDLSEMTRSLKGNKEILQKLISHLLEIYPERLSTIKQAIKQKKYALLRQQSHTLKGAVLNFKAQRAGDLAYKLEKMGLDSNLDKAKETFYDLEKEMERIRQYLAEAGWERTVS